MELYYYSRSARSVTARRSADAFTYSVTMIHSEDTFTTYYASPVGMLKIAATATAVQEVLFCTEEDRQLASSPDDVPDLLRAVTRDDVRSEMPSPYGVDARELLAACAAGAATGARRRTLPPSQKS